MQILATHLSDKAVDFREIDYTRPTRILDGSGETGITQEALDLGGSWGYHHSDDRYGTVAERLLPPPRSFFMRSSASGRTRARICVKIACCRKMNSSACRLRVVIRCWRKSLNVKVCLILASISRAKSTPMLTGGDDGGSNHHVRSLVRRCSASIP